MAVLNKCGQAYIDEREVTPIFRKEFRARQMFICVCILAISSILIVGGFEKIKGMDYIGEKIWKNQYMLYGLGQDSWKEKLIKTNHYFSRNTEVAESTDDNRKTTEAMAEAENHLVIKEEMPEEQDNKQLSETYREAAVTQPVQKSEIVETLKSTMDYSYLLKNFYIVDRTTSVTKEIFPVKKLLEKNFKMEKKETYQILIYHTHGASESYADSRAGKEEDSVVGTGTLLAEELHKYGYVVYHDKTKYDLIDGVIDRSLAYNKSLAGIEKIMKENPDIEVVIDLHRDGVEGKQKNITEMEGKKTAQVMFFNGLSRGKSGEISYLKNKNRQSNLAFSLQLKCKGMEQYPGFIKPIYLKGYRYNLHVKEKSLLIELGNQNNTMDEIHNAVAPLAKIINDVLMPTD